MQVDTMARQINIRAKAIERLVSSRANEEPSAAMTEDWERWISDPDHRSEFDSVIEVWVRSGSVGPLPVPTAEELDADEYDGSESIAEWSARQALSESLSPPRKNRQFDEPRDSRVTEAPASPSKRARRWRAAALAASLVVAAVGWLVFPQLESMINGEPEFYETGLAEHRSVSLQDGSTILLGARTSLWVTFSRQRRTVVLERGEALFDVAKDKRRPFSVHAGYGTITAVGTSFSVQRDRERVEVTVAEGIVRVEPRVPERGERKSASAQHVVAMLSSGQQVKLDDLDAGRITISRVDAELETSWREGRLQYVDKPLVDVVADVNRYAKRQVILDGSPTHALRFTGLVFQSNADRWVDQLTDIFPALEVVEMDADHLTLRMRAEGFGRTR
jgi:transmembrane sensor